MRLFFGYMGAVFVTCYFFDPKPVAVSAEVQEALDDKESLKYVQHIRESKVQRRHHYYLTGKIRD